MTLRIKQDEKYVGNDWWEWSVWIDGPAEELAQVMHLVYTLHPTFRPPVETITTRKNGFRLRGSGWGTFTMYIDIVFRDKTVKKRKYDLKLHYPSDDVIQETTRSRSVKKVYLSSSASEVDTAEAIRNSLASRGVEVIANNDLGAGMPLSKEIEASLSGAEHAVFVLSGQPNLWMAREIEAARRHSVPVTTVLVGDNLKTTSYVTEGTSIHIRDASEVERTVAELGDFPGAK